MVDPYPELQYALHQRVNNSRRFASGYIKNSLYTWSNLENCEGGRCNNTETYNRSVLTQRVHWSQIIVRNIAIDKGKTGTFMNHHTSYAQIHRPERTVHLDSFSRFPSVGAVFLLISGMMPCRYCGIGKYLAKTNRRLARVEKGSLPLCGT